ncbi:MAG: hypothetical protein CMK32_09935 [Porticoccaceae bacterium]|nr:hypothetical protein [Porticoccaceae bacterium]
MSVAVAFGTDLDIEIGGEKISLPPLTMYDLARLENAYIEHLFEKVKIDTQLSTPEEKKEAVAKVRETRLMLSEDAMPLLQWIVKNGEGQVAALRQCLEPKYPGKFTKQDIAKWMFYDAVDKQHFQRWMVVSGILADPTSPSMTTEPETEEKTVQPDSASTT